MELHQKNSIDFKRQKFSSPGYHDLYKSGLNSKADSKFIREGKIHSTRKNRRNTTSADEPSSP